MRPESESRALVAALARVEEILSWPAERLYTLAESVSRWTPAQQLQHVLLSLERILDVIGMLEEGTDERIRTRGAPRLTARAIFLTGIIPRGRAEAPDFARPDAVPGRSGLREKLAAVRSAVRDLDARAAQLKDVPRTFAHPLLGRFNAVQWLRFARVHTEHHLAIVDDIDRTGARVEPLVDPLKPLGDVP